MTASRTRVSYTYEETSPGVPLWGPNAVTTDLPTGATTIAIENLLSGKHYYIKTWNEDQFGNKSREVTQTINTPPPTRLVPLSLSANGYLDSGSPMRAYVVIPSDTLSVASAIIKLAFRQFMAPATASTAGSGTLTSDSGGSSTSGASSASTTGTSPHTHYWAVWLSNTPDGTATNKKYQDAWGTGTVNLPTATGGSSLRSGYEAEGEHTHGMGHTHSTPSHQHTVPTHTHGLTYGTYEEAYPTSQSVKVYVYQRVGATWTLVHTSASLTSDLEDVDLTAVITGPGDWRIEVLSDAAQPNGGRLGLDLFGTFSLVVG